MSNLNNYPVFEADQVLKSEHLNGLFNYLDEQNRLTRSHLVGVGIVCGLQSSYANNEINITAGLGITSLGYLVSYEGDNFTHARSYELPDDILTDNDPDNFQTDVRSYYTGFSMWQLFESTAANPATANDTALSDTTFLRDKVTVLFLELTVTDLKNCTTNDCDDKGKNASFNIIPMLMLQSDLEKFKYAGFETAKAALPDVMLKRLNIPFKELKSATDILNAFYAVADSSAIKNIADAYKSAYDVFDVVLQPETTNPFGSLEATLTSQVNDAKNKNVVYTEYFYDYLDDLIKAYNEFREAGDELLTECRPDANLFPFHIALCEAMNNSAITVSAYRNYFIHSPVFDGQKNMSMQLQSLFERMKQLPEEFKIPPELLPVTVSGSRVPAAQIKITPSQYGTAPLSKRAIPYYYNVHSLLTNWSYEKTKKGKASKNLSYYANTYSSDDAVKNPLLYELEPYNFFRIEGHINQHINAALPAVLKQKQNNSLPIDVIALNTVAGTDEIDTSDLKCYFNDLESLYNVLTAELLCRLHEPACTISKLPYYQFVTKFSGLAGGIFTTGLFGSLLGARSLGTTTLSGETREIKSVSDLRRDPSLTTGIGETASGTGVFKPLISAAETHEIKVAGEALSDTVSSAGKPELQLGIRDLPGNFLQVFNPVLGLVFTPVSGTDKFIDDAKLMEPYLKGTMLRHFCNPKQFDDKTKSAGQVYLETIEKNQASLSKPSDSLPGLNADIVTWINYVNQHLQYFIDVAERLLASIAPLTLSEFSYNNFSVLYELMKEEAASFTAMRQGFIVFVNSLKKDDKTTEHEAEANTLAAGLISADTAALSQLCMDERLETLVNEYKKRIDSINLQKIFSEYTSRHTGMEHKAGVPKGGTFILVYEQRKVSGGDNINIAAAETSATVKGNIAVSEKSILSSSAFTKSRTRNTGVFSSAIQDDSSSKFSELLNLNKSLLSDDDFNKVKDIITKVPGFAANTSSADFSIAPGIVFADFFLPYMCCSECAPISYIVQETPVEEPLTISLDKNAVCSNDNKNVITITVTPAGGTVSATLASGGSTTLSKAVKISDTTYTVLPSDLPAGTMAIGYTVGSDSTSSAITLFTSPSAAFDAKQNASSSALINFTGDAANADVTYEWDFGDGNIANTATPIIEHNYDIGSGQTKSFTVTLKVTSKDGCTGVQSHDVTISVDAPATIDIKQPVFCSNDAGDVSVTVSPAGGKLSFDKALQTGPNNFIIHVSDLPLGDTIITYTFLDKTASKTVTIHAAPKADFTGTALTAAARLFQFTSDPATANMIHNWDFGDTQSGAGNTSREANPTHAFSPLNSDFVFTVTHTVTSPDNCFASSQQQITVSAQLPIPVNETKTFCFSENIPLEAAGSFTDASVKTDDTLKALMEKNKFSINDKMEIVFSETLNETISFNIQYNLNTSTGTLQKTVAVTVIAAVNTHFNVLSLAANKTIRFTALAASPETVRWSILVNGQQKISGDKTPFDISLDAFANMISLSITLTIVQKENAAECKGTKSVRMTRDEFTAMQRIRGGLNF